MIENGSLIGMGAVVLQHARVGAGSLIAAGAVVSERAEIPPGVLAAGNRQVPSLSPGDRVNHDSYGLGTVLSVEGRGDDPEAKIDFGGDYGIKHLVLRYAPIEKL